MKLGDKVKDSISGFEGIMTGHIRYAHNCDRVLVRPQAMKDGKPIEGDWFDAPSLRLVYNDVVPVIAPAPSLFGMGDVVADTVTDLKGTAIGFATYLSGCVRVGIQPAAVKDGKPADEVWLPQTQLKLVKAGKREKEKEKPGGPMRDPGYKY